MTLCSLGIATRTTRLRLLGFALALLASYSAVVVAEPANVRARVQCTLASGRSFPFAAGRDRCWEPINGKTLTITSVAVCADQTTAGILEVTFRFSEVAGAQCPERETATSDQIRGAIQQLGPQERAFVLVSLDIH